MSRNGDSLPVCKLWQACTDETAGKLNKGHGMERTPYWMSEKMEDTLAFIKITEIKEVEMVANCRRVCYRYCDVNGVEDGETGGQIEYIDLSPYGLNENEIDVYIDEHFSDKGHMIY